MFYNKSQKGFGLVEILIVIAIMGILGSIVTSRVNVARTKAQVAAIKANMRNLHTAADLYRSDNSNSYTVGTYNGSCDSATDLFTNTKIETMMNQIKRQASLTDFDDVLQCYVRMNPERFGIVVKGANVGYGGQEHFCTDSDTKATNIYGDGDPADIYSLTNGCQTN